MRKILLSLATVMACVLPARAQLGLPQNFEYQFRAPTKFTHGAFIAIPSQGDMPGGLAAPTQQIGVINGKYFGNNAVFSSTTGAANNLTTALPASTFGRRTGKRVNIHIKGNTAANGNTKVLNLIFGTTTIALMNAAANNKDFDFEVEIYNTGNNTQQISVSGYANSAFVNGLDTTSAQAQRSPITIQLNLPAATAAGDINVTSYTVAADS